MWFSCVIGDRTPNTAQGPHPRGRPPPKRRTPIPLLPKHVKWKRFLITMFDLRASVYDWGLDSLKYNTCSYIFRQKPEEPPQWRQANQEPCRAPRPHKKKPTRKQKGQLLNHVYITIPTRSGNFVQLSRRPFVSSSILSEKYPFNPDGKWSTIMCMIFAKKCVCSNSSSLLLAASEAV